MKKLAMWIIAFDLAMIVLMQTGILDEKSSENFFYVWCGLLLVAIVHVIAAEVKAAESQDAAEGRFVGPARQQTLP